jgi:hypothetical protein
MRDVHDDRMGGRKEITFDLNQGVVDVDTHGKEEREGEPGQGTGDRPGDGVERSKGFTRLRGWPGSWKLWDRLGT